MAPLVMKFGGTSVGSAQALGQAATIVQEQAGSQGELVVVVSAMSGVTDALISGARTAAAGDDQTYRATVTELRSLFPITEHCASSLFSFVPRLTTL